MPVFRFGSDQPRVVFIGPEEYLLGPVVLAMQLRDAALVPADRVAFHEALAAELEHEGHPDGPEARRVCTQRGVEAWTAMSRVVAGLRGEAGAAAVTDAYDRLGRHEGETLLLELFPLPKKGLDKWTEEHRQYTNPDFATQKPYYSAVWHRRSADAPRAVELRAILDALPAGTFVVQYSTGANNEFGERFAHVVPGTTWEAVIDGRIRVGRTPLGHIVAATGALSGRSRTKLTKDHLDVLVESLLRTAAVPGELPLNPLPAVNQADAIEMNVRRRRRPTSYALLSPAERRRIDTLLGLIDPETGIPLL